MGKVSVGPDGLVPQDEAGNPVGGTPQPLPRPAKPRRSVDELAHARRECVPCREPRKEGAAIRPPIGPLTYVTTARLLADTRALIGHLPPGVDCVAAVPRSGLLPGALVAYHLHCPLWTVSRQAGLVFPGHGGRMDGPAAGPARHVLIVDDTAALGQEMAHAAPAVAAAFPGARVTRAAVYCHPQALHAVDLCVSVYPGLHFLEWNWCNSGSGSACCFDFDGILCRDFTAAEVLTAESYRAAMESVTPLFLPRRRPVPLVLTARPESTRGLTLAWLARWGVRAETLLMWPGDAPPWGPGAADVAKWKAGHYKESGTVLMAESDPFQAELIAGLSGKPVLCPAAEKVFPGGLSSCSSATGYAL